jgi:hypothetical protein
MKVNNQLTMGKLYNFVFTVTKVSGTSYALDFKFYPPNINVTFKRVFFEDASMFFLHGLNFSTFLKVIGIAQCVESYIYSFVFTVTKASGTS